MAVTDESYFDWPLRPEAPSSLNLSVAGNTATLRWQTHAGNPTGIAVERQIRKVGTAKETWTRIAKLLSTATEYSDSSLKLGERFAYRVRAFSSDGESA
jgi:hypothetical protein